MDPFGIAGGFGTGLLDGIKRLFGGDQSGDAGTRRQPGDVSRLLSAQARELLQLAAAHHPGSA